MWARHKTQHRMCRRCDVCFKQQRPNEVIQNDYQAYVPMSHEDLTEGPTLHICKKCRTLESKMVKDIRHFAGEG